MGTWRSTQWSACSAKRPAKDDLEDLINVAVEQLVRQRFELPAFDTLNRAARRVRAAFNRALYKRVYDALSEDDLARLDALFISDLTTFRTGMSSKRMLATRL